MDVETLQKDLKDWEDRQLEELDQWEESQWADYDAAPEGKGMDRIDDGAACIFRMIDSKVQAATALLERAIEAEAAGRAARSRACVAEFRQLLSGDYRN